MKIAVIDCDSIIYHAFHPKKIMQNGVPKRSEDGKRYLYDEKSEGEVIDSCDYLMNSILTKGGFNGYIGFVKGINTVDNRLLINPEYKGNRSKEAPKYWNLCVRYLVDNWKMNYSNYIEVDDSVNITYNQLIKLNVGEIYRVGIDKDILNLDGDSYNWFKNEFIYNLGDHAKRYFWSSMIIGDSADNIKGIPGVGKANVIFTNSLFKPTPEYVLSFYIHHFGEIKGIDEFYKNYKCLKILDEDKDFVIPEIIEYKNKNVKEERIEEW